MVFNLEKCHNNTSQNKCDQDTRMAQWVQWVTHVQELLPDTAAWLQFLPITASYPPTLLPPFLSLHCTYLITDKKQLKNTGSLIHLKLRAYMEEKIYFGVKN